MRLDNLAGVLGGLQLIQHSSKGNEMNEQVMVRRSASALIQEALSTGADREAVVDAVIEAITPDGYEAALRELIGARLSSEMGRVRSGVTPPIRLGMTKRELIRTDYWPEFLRTPFADADGVLRPLAEASADDLRHLAEVRRVQSAELLVRADQFDVLADLMVRSRVKRLADLDRSAGAGVIERAA